jgi:2-keto-3-deoxy-galactonokinase
MTGELFDVLSAHSLLRASVQADHGPAWASWEDPASREAFAQGVRSAASPGLAPSLFQTRVRTVLGSVLPPVNRWFLSGLLIGAEAEGLSRAELDVPILLAAAEPLSAAYLFAFQTLGLGGRLTVAPPDTVALASVLGHRALLQRWLKSEGTAASQ